MLSMLRAMFQNVFFVTVVWTVTVCPTSAQPTLYQAIQGNSNYSQFVRLVDSEPYVVQVLNGTNMLHPTGQYTLLAPDNDAIDAAGKLLGASGAIFVQSLLNQPPQSKLVEELLLLHIVNGTLDASTVTPPESFLGTFVGTMLTTSNSISVEIVVRPSTYAGGGLAANNVDLQQLNTTVASNGVLHSLNQFFVIVPDIEDFACSGFFTYLCFFAQINEVQDILSYNRNDPQGPWTMLAPTQEAFQNEPFINKIILDLEAWEDHGGYLIKNMLSLGEYREASFPPQEGMYPIEFQNLNGVTFNIYNNPVVTFDGYEPLVSDIDLRNGYMHIMNDVLMPLTMRSTMYELLELTLFRSLMDSASYGSIVDGEGPLTVFWPTNTALIAMQTEYKDYYRTILSPANKDQLIEFLQYHTVPDVNIRSYGRDEDVYSFTTSLQNETLTMTLENGMFTVNDANDSQNLPSQVIDGNIFASNGVMHQIDRVLIPPQYRNPPVPITPAPVTPAPVTPAPTVVVVVAPVPVTVTTPAPVTPAPVTPAPVTSAPPTVAPPTEPTPTEPTPTEPTPTEPTPTEPTPTEPTPTEPTPTEPTTPAPIEDSSTPSPMESNNNNVSSSDDTSSSSSAPSISPVVRQTAQPSLFNPQGPPPAPTTSGGTRSTTIRRSRMMGFSTTIMTIMIYPWILLLC